MEKYLAQIKIGPEGGFRGFGPLGLEGITSAQAPLVFNKVISTTIGVMSIVAFVWFTINFLLAALGIIFSGGDKAKLAEARSKIMTNLIGIVVVVSAVFLIEVIGNILGIEILRGALFVPSLLIK